MSCVRVVRVCIVSRRVLMSLFFSSCVVSVLCCVVLPPKVRCRCSVGSVVEELNDFVAQSAQGFERPALRWLLSRGVGNSIACPLPLVVLRVVGPIVDMPRRRSRLALSMRVLGTSILATAP